MLNRPVLWEFRVIRKFRDYRIVHVHAHICKSTSLCAHARARERECACASRPQVDDRTLARWGRPTFICGEHTRAHSQAVCSRADREP